MQIPFIDLTAQMRIPFDEGDMEDEIFHVVEEVIDSGRFLGGGYTEAFEAAFAEYVGTKHCIAVDSGTTALTIALRGLGIGKGSEVVTTPLSFIATAGAIRKAGATPIFAGLESDRGCLPGAWCKGR